MQRLCSPETPKLFKPHAAHLIRVSEAQALNDALPLILLAIAHLWKIVSTATRTTTKGWHAWCKKSAKALF